MMALRKLSDYEEIFETMEDVEQYIKENDIPEYRVKPIEYGKAYGLLPKEVKSKAEKEFIDPFDENGSHERS